MLARCFEADVVVVRREELAEHARGPGLMALQDHQGVEPGVLDRAPKAVAIARFVDRLAPEPADRAALRVSPC